MVPARELEEFIRTSNNTLDLRGKRVEEALTLVEEFLDGALISGMSPLMIIHGHGTGAIKKAVREYMKTSRYVRSYRAGRDARRGRRGHGRRCQVINSAITYSISLSGFQSSNLSRNRRNRINIQHDVLIAPGDDPLKD